MSTGCSIPSQATTTTPTPALPRHDTLAELEKSVRQDDWNVTGRLATLLSSDAVPHDREALEAYLHRLRAVLTAARVGRARLALSLNRLHVAAKFTNAGALDRRQVSVISAKS